MRPVYHCKENQTRGHVLLCMSAYAIIKELENKLYPFLKNSGSVEFIYTFVKI